MDSSIPSSASITHRNTSASASAAPPAPMLPPILPPDVPSLSKKPLQALISVGGIYLMYLMYGKFQAQLYRAQEDGTKFGTSGGTFFVLFVQCFTNALIAALVVGVELLYLGHKRELPKKEKDLDKNEKEVKLVPFVEVLFSFELALASFVYVFAMYTSNEALNYVPYSFQAIVKSCKMVPVMIGSIVVSNAKYGLNKWVSVLLIAGGILAFSYVGGEKDDKKKKHGGAQTTSIFGVLLLCASLTLDAVSGPLMKKVDKFGLLSTQNMLASNVWASAYMLVLAGALGQVGGAIGYLLEHNNVAWVLLNFSMTSALGQLFIFYCLREFTPLILTTITTTRKFMTVVATGLLFPDEALNKLQWLCTSIVFSGIVLGELGEDKKHGKKEDGGATK